jgi:CubicO group peptidase (beta-lactamase class C family)
MRGRPRIVLFLLTILATAFHPIRAWQKPQLDLDRFAAYAAGALKDWNVPGMAVAVVNDDQVVLAKGFGVRKLGEPAPVDDRTLFAIGSCTKAFTAAALGILVDQGKLKWDDPVTNYLPWFQLYDPYVTREMTVRDLLSHRSGLQTFGGDLIWYHSTYDRNEVIRRVRFLKPVSSFRSRFGYQNIMFLAAGQIVQAITGKSWDDFIKERLFTPLEMRDSNTSILGFKPGDDFAAPHNERDGKLRVIGYCNADNIAPAGAINSSVRDLAQWIRLQLGRGSYQGKQVFSGSASREMWSPQTIIPVGEQAEQQGTHFQAYGLGWLLSDYHGRKLISHGGGLDGMISQVGLMPEENLGVVILTNSETPLAGMMMRKLFDMQLGLPERDYSAEALKQRATGLAARKTADAGIDAGRASGTHPSLALERYAGRYEDKMYGQAAVALENGKLVLRFIPSPDFVADLEHWHYDSFLLRWRDQLSYPFPKGFVTFELSAQGKVVGMKIDQPNNDFNFDELDFRRVSDTNH